MKITIFGTGYVGLVTGACLAEVGNEVCCIDIDKKRIKSLKNGDIPFYEPGLSKLVEENIKNGRLFFSTNYKDGLNHSEFLFICIGTPQSEDGSADVTSIEDLINKISKNVENNKIVIIKSTVPVGTSERLENISSHNFKERKVDLNFELVSNPEFLKEGDAVLDFMKPDRIIIGAKNKKIFNRVSEIYLPFNRNRNRCLFMSQISSELTKYASNCMLATKISFINEMANLSEKIGADIEDVRLGIGSDERIGYSFIYPGPGFGGSCFLKDINSLIHTSKTYGHDPKILSAVNSVNNRQKNILFRKIKSFYKDDLSKKTAAIWGLSFKAGTSDMRESPSINLIESLLAEKINIKIYDPFAMDECRKIFGKNKYIFYANSINEALKETDFLAIVTEWKEFRSVNPELFKLNLKDKVIFDGRNIFDPIQMKKYEFKYFGIGRGDKI